jgi:hypothetical protein
MCCYGEKKAASGEEKEKTLILRHRRLSLWQGHSVTLSFFAFFLLKIYHRCLHLCTPFFFFFCFSLVSFIFIKKLFLFV